jgi:hypothetical protein
MRSAWRTVLVVPLQTPTRLLQRTALEQAGQRVWMQRVRNGGLACDAEVAHSLQVEISPGMRTYIDAALKLLSEPR